MSNYYVYVGSITNAMRGKKILEEQGIRSYLHRASPSLEGDGCGYSLLVTSSVEKAVSILQNRGVRVIRVAEGM